jgi:hypothetical protein
MEQELATSKTTAISTSVQRKQLPVVYKKKTLEKVQSNVCTALIESTGESMLCLGCCKVPLHLVSIRTFL